MHIYLPQFIIGLIIYEDSEQAENNHYTAKGRVILAVNKEKYENIGILYI